MTIKTINLYYILHTIYIMHYISYLISPEYTEFTPETRFGTGSLGFHTFGLNKRDFTKG
jgi:hypothetical protein